MNNVYVVVWRYDHAFGGPTESGARQFTDRRKEAIEFYKDMVDEAQTDDAINPSVALYCNGRMIANHLDLVGEYTMFTDRIYSGKYGVRFAD